MGDGARYGGESLRGTKGYAIPSAMRRAFLGLVLLISVITGIAGAVFYPRIHRFWGITQTDFSVFYDAGYRCDRHESMYTYRATRYTTDREYLFKYAPAFGLAMIPLSRLPVQMALRWWYVIVGVSLLGAFACVTWLLRPTPTSPTIPGIAYVGSGLLILRPYLANLRLGQIDVILAALLLTFLVALQRRRDVLAGWCLAAAMLCKLVPAIWLVYLVMTRRWRALLWTGLAVIVYLASPALHLGVAGAWHATQEWWATLQVASENAEWLVRFKNQSVLSLMLRLLVGADPTAVTPIHLQVATGLTIVAALVFAWMIWRTWQRTGPLEHPVIRWSAPSLVMIAMVIFSPHAWKATFIHLLLPYAVLLVWLLTTARRDYLGWALLALSFLLISVTAPDLVLPRLVSQTAHLYSPMTWGALVLAVGMWRVGRTKLS